jgi:methyl-accepting chemotaxis protein
MSDQQDNLFQDDEVFIIDNIQNLKKTLASVKRYITDVDAKVGDLTESIADSNCKDELGAYSKKLRLIEENSGKIVNTIGAIKKMHNEIDIDALKSINSIESVINDFTEKIISSADSIQKTVDIINEQSDTVNRLIDAVNTSKDTVDMVGTIKGIKTTISKLTTEIIDSKQKLSTVQSDVSARTNTMKQNIDHVIEAYDRLNDIAEQSEEFKTALKQCAGELKTLCNDIDGQLLSYNNTVKSISSVLEGVSANSRLITERISLINAANDEIAALNKNLSEHHSTIESTANTIRDNTAMQQNAVTKLDDVAASCSNTEQYMKNIATHDDIDIVIAAINTLANKIKDERHKTVLSDIKQIVASSDQYHLVDDIDPDDDESLNGLFRSYIGYDKLLKKIKEELNKIDD